MKSLEQLDFLSGCTETAEMFNSYYEVMLNEYKDDKETLRSMREIAQRQCEYLAREMFQEAANYGLFTDEQNADCFHIV